MLNDPPIHYLGLSAAARRFCIDGKHVHASTVFRWMKDGVLRRGHRVRLGYVRLGNRIATTQDDIDAFTRLLREADEAPSYMSREPHPAIHGRKKRSVAQRQAALRCAEEQLHKAGL